MPVTGVRSYMRRNGEQVSSHARGYGAGTAPTKPNAGAQAKRNIAAAGVAVTATVAGVVEVLASLIGLLDAVIVFVTVVLGLFGGYKGRHKLATRMRRAARRTGKVARAVRPTRSPSQIDAYTRRKLQRRQQRWDRQEARWTGRRERIGAAWRGRQKAAKQRWQGRESNAVVQRVMGRNEP